jgi:hypothetical protein
MSEQFTDFEISDLGLNDVQEWGGEQRPLCAPGIYKLRVKSLEKKAAKSSQQPMIAVTYEVVEAFETGEGVEAAAPGTHVYNNYSLSQKALGRLKAFSVACGAQLDKFIASQHIGAEIQGEVIHTRGADQVAGDGSVKEGGTFANVINETPLQAVAAPTPTTQPPIMNKGGNSKPATTTRRA